MTAFLESDGKSVSVTLSATVAAETVAYVSGWLGITVTGGDTGDDVALNIDEREYQFDIPAALDVAVGDIVYIDTAQVTDHIPDDAGYGKVAGAGLKALFKATTAHYTTPDATRACNGKLLPEGV